MFLKSSQIGKEIEALLRSKLHREDGMNLVFERVYHQNQPTAQSPLQPGTDFPCQEQKHEFTVA